MGIRRKRLLSAVLSAVVVVLAMSGTGIAASASPLPGPDFSTSQGIDAYLQSRGIDPSTVIQQTGLNNYVGDSCPGKGWHCIAPTDKPVVQIAPAGGTNDFTCSPGTGSGSCFVLQISAGPAGDPRPENNVFNCFEGSLANSAMLDAGACGSMMQVNSTGGDNRATIVQAIAQRSGTYQSATETAGPFSQTQTNGSGGNNEITIGQASLQYSSDKPTATQTVYVSQTSTSGKNQATVGQLEQQQVSDAASTQDQEGTQVACVTQDSQTGPNVATVGQLMSQNEQDSASGIQQFQNRYTGPQSTCGTAETSVSPNLAALVQQNQNTPGATGQDQMTVKQSLTQQEQSSTPSGTVSQQQGPTFDAGGLEAIPTQTSGGLSTLDISQNEQQNMKASTSQSNLSQSQQDPLRQPDCFDNDCSQGSNSRDTFTLTQTGVQQADQAGQPNMAAQQNFDIEGDCFTSGTCSIQSTNTSNGVTTSQPGSCSSSSDDSCSASTSVISPGDECDGDGTPDVTPAGTAQSDAAGTAPSDSSCGDG